MKETSDHVAFLGVWRGVINQHPRGDWDDKSQHFSIKVSLWQSQGVVQGTQEIQVKEKEKPGIIVLTSVISNVKQQPLGFFSYEFNSLDKSIIQYGFAIFKIQENMIVGNYVAYGPQSETSVTGQGELNRIEGNVHV